MIVKKSTETWVPIVLISSADFNTDISGLVYNSVGLVVKYIKEGGDWVTKSLSAGDWDICDASAGVRIYKIKFSALELDTLGYFAFSVYATGAVTYDGLLEIKNNTVDDIASAISGLNDFDPASEKVLINDITQGQIDDIETAAVTTLPTAISGLPALVWAYSTRTLSSFGTLIASIWSAVTRTLTAGTKDAEIDSIKNTVEAISTTNFNGGGE